MDPPAASVFLILRDAAARLLRTNGEVLSFAKRPLEVACQRKAFGLGGLRQFGVAVLLRSSQRRGE